MYVCLWSPGWSTGGESAAEGTVRLAETLSELAPRLRIEPDRIWADGRGLDPVALATRLLERLAVDGVAARAGVSALPVTAELAARWGRPRRKREQPTPFLVKERTGFGWRRSAPASASPLAPAPAPSTLVVDVPPGEETEWMGRLPVAALVPDPRLRTLLDGVGITTVAGLAALAREAVEVRFGPEAVPLWRLARGDDRRILFRRRPPPRPHGSIDFVDYVLTDPARLVFTANALLGPICESLTTRGEHARALRITLPLANGSAWRRTLRPARPTASRETWLRLIRALLERLTVADAVAGMLIEVAATEPAAVRQGDLFDRGFATAAAVEAAVARLVERQVQPVAPHTSAHPLLERRTRWVSTAPGEIADTQTRPATARPATTSDPTGSVGSAGSAGSAPARAPTPATGSSLSIQVLPEPRRVTVETARRREHEMPLRVRERGGWHTVLRASGPDRISGGQWEERPFAREYFRCVTSEGVCLWIYRDALDGSWHLQGWWD